MVMFDRRARVMEMICLCQIRCQITQGSHNVWYPRSPQIHRLPSTGGEPSANKLNENDFIDNEHLAEERITNPFWESSPDAVTLRNELIDEIIAYPIGRTYAILYGQNDLHRNCGAAYDVTGLPEDLRNCLTRHSSVPGVAPELFSSNAAAITIVNLALQPRWETERIIMKLQHSVLELINLMEE